MFVKEFSKFQNFIARKSDVYDMFRVYIQCLYLAK